MIFGFPWSQRTTPAPPRAATLLGMDEEIRHMQTEVQDAHRLVALLVRRLGGEVTIMDLEWLTPGPTTTIFSQRVGPPIGGDGGTRLVVRP